MRPLPTLRYGGVASAVFVSVLGIGGLLVAIGDLSLSIASLSSRVSAVAALVGSSSMLSPLQPGNALRPCSEFAICLSTSIVANIPNARAVVRTECERTIAERDAFADFQHRVAALDPPNPSPDAHSQMHELPQTIDPHLSQSSPPTGLDDIQQAYRETVMSIPHYNEEYDEPLAQNLAFEVGEELAAAITTHSQLTPYLQHTIVQAAGVASNRREQFIPRLNTERRILEEMQQTLGEITEQHDQLTAQPRYQQSIEDLQEAHDGLTSCLTACEQVLDERQTHRTAGHTAEPHTDEIVDLHEYLYQSLDVTYPVLADGTTLLERCETARRRVADDLVRRS